MAKDQPRQAAEDSAGTALLSAMTTEHFVMQGALTATVSEANSRATIYVMALSSALVAIGFAADADFALAPFVSCLLAGVFILGVFTVLRMVDIAIENMTALIVIARVRAHYRTLGPEAARLFAPEHGRWPEAGEPSLRIGPFAGYLTTAAMMVATINALVAGAGVAYLVDLLGGRLGWAFAAGVAGVAAVLTPFFLYQRWRIDELDKAYGRPR